MSACKLCGQPSNALAGKVIALDVGHGQRGLAGEQAAAACGEGACGVGDGNGTLAADQLGGYRLWHLC